MSGRINESVTRPQPPKQDTVSIGNLKLIGVENYKVYNHGKKEIGIVFGGEKMEYFIHYNPNTLTEPAYVTCDKYHPRGPIRKVKIDNFYDVKFTATPRTDHDSRIVVENCKNSTVHVEDNTTSEFVKYVGGGKHDLSLGQEDDYTHIPKKIDVMY